jgi:hypothetical protein
MLTVGLLAGNYFNDSFCKVSDLPPFLPNEYLFTTHADKGTEKWEIYAWALRDIMAKVGDFKLNNQPTREKF